MDDVNENTYFVLLIKESVKESDSRIRVESVEEHELQNGGIP
jgi:hypothetical protein